MIKAPECFKRFSSARARFLESALNIFFKREFPKLLGPILRRKLVEELINLIQDLLPLKEHVKPGQIVWNAVSTKTRADSPNVRFVPVTLTMIHEHDVQQLADGVPMTTDHEAGHCPHYKRSILAGSIAFHARYRPVDLALWRCDFGQYRKRYEKEQNVTLPHTGSLHDMGSCVSHKSMIIRKITIDKKDPLVVAQETNHSIGAVDRYIKDFNRVRLCHQDGKDMPIYLFSHRIKISLWSMNT